MSNYEQINMGITAWPGTAPPQHQEEPEILDIDPKLLKIMKKYKYNWRLDQLSKQVPFKTAEKFIPEPVTLIQATTPKEIELDEGINFRCDHLSRPNLRYLTETKKMHRPRGKKFNKNMTLSIKKARQSIYNYYKILERRKQERLRAQKSGKEKKKSKQSIDKARQAKEEIYRKLASPKRLFGPTETLIKLWKPLEELKPRLETLANPKEAPEVRSRPLGKVRPAALVYEITEHTMKLATTIPKRYLEKTKIPIPGWVSKAAMKYKPTELIEKLAQPKVRREGKATVDDDEDPWQITPNALKYKPTPRILELAKPLERD